MSLYLTMARSRTMLDTFMPSGTSPWEAHQGPCVTHTCPLAHPLEARSWSMCDTYLPSGTSPWGLIKVHVWHVSALWHIPLRPNQGPCVTHTYPMAHPLEARSWSMCDTYLPSGTSPWSLIMVHVCHIPALWHIPLRLDNGPCVPHTYPLAHPLEVWLRSMCDTYLPSGTSPWGLIKVHVWSLMCILCKSAL